jgi:hypothetical protein
VIWLLPIVFELVNLTTVLFVPDIETDVPDDPEVPDIPDDPEVPDIPLVPSVPAIANSRRNSSLLEALPPTDKTSTVKPSHPVAGLKS